MSSPKALLLPCAFDCEHCSPYGRIDLPTHYMDNFGHWKKKPIGAREEHWGMNFYPFGLGAKGYDINGIIHRHHAKTRLRDTVGKALRQQWPDPIANLMEEFAFGRYILHHLITDATNKKFRDDYDLLLYTYSKEYPQLNLLRLIKC